MPKSKRKKTDSKRSEIKKYQDTMMADMGLQSLDELSSNEERKRWIKALMPSKGARKKLKEMGYSLYSDDNKRSLGSNRSCELRVFRKIANTSVAAEDLTSSIRDLTSKVKAQETSLLILKELSSEKVQSKNFNKEKLKARLEQIISEAEVEKEYFIFYIGSVVENASEYNAKFLSSTDAFVSDSSSQGSVMESMREKFSSDSGYRVSRDHENREEVAVIQRVLEDNGYTLFRHGVSGRYESETEDSVILFQQHNSLEITGHVNRATFEAMTNNPKPLPHESRRERSNRRGEESPQDESGPSGIDHLSHIELTSDRVDIKNASPMLKEYLQILNQVAKDLNGKIYITSAKRTSYDQARIMLGNYKRRGAGTNRANSYLKSLYRRFPNIDEITNIYSEEASDESKIKRVEEIVERSWPKGGHRSGKSIDVRFKGNTEEILRASQDLATVDVLKESDHFHVTIKSLKPGGIKNMRRFNA